MAITATTGRSRPYPRILGLLLLLVSHAHAEQLPIRTYTTADGLAQDRVKRIVRDSRGFLWFCTADGLSRFDGNQFVTYDAAQGLSYPTVNDLIETRNGVYWVATNGGGVFLFDPEAAKAARAGGPDGQASGADGVAAKAPLLFFNYLVGDNPRTNRVNKLYEDSSGRIWAGTDHGVFVLDPKADPQNFRNVGWAVPDLARRIVQVWAFVEDPEENLWLGTTAGLVCRSPVGRMRNYSAWPEGTGSVYDLFWDREGRLWASGRGGLLIAYPESLVGAAEGQTALWRMLRRSADDLRERRIVLPITRGEAYAYTRNDGLAHDFVVDLFPASDGRLWLATHGGMSVLDGARLRSYTKALGLREQIFSAVAEDRDGNLWFGSNSSGALKLAKNGLISYREQDGLNNTHIVRIFEDDEGKLCVVDWSFSVACLADQEFYEIRLNLPGKPLRIDDVLHDHLGEWWVATSNGVYRFGRGNAEHLTRGRPRNYTVEHGLPTNSVRRLFEDSRGDIWIGANGPEPVGRWDRATGKFHRYGTGNELVLGGDVFSFAEDTAGGVWLGFRDQGLVRYKDGHFTILTDADRLPSRQTPTVYVDRAGRLWAAATARGLIRIDDPTAAQPHIRVYSTADGLTSNFINTITEDDMGHIYVGTTRSIDQLDPATDRVRQYTVADGLAANESHSVYRDASGALWFGTANGLSRLIPQPEKAALPPPILIGGVSIAGVSQPVSALGETEVALAELDHSQNQAQIEFFGLSFALGDVLRYQVKLEGADRDWGAPVEQRSINYANLKPGSYRFLVRAVNAHGDVSQQTASVAFTIVPPLWQRSWFLLLVALALAVGTHFIYRYHAQRLIELERVRTRIATDLHDDIGASLSKIAILSDVANQDLAPEESQVAEPLAQIAGTSREMVDAMSDIVWAVNPQRDHLSDLTHRMRRFAEDLLDARGIEFTFRIPTDDKDIRLGADLRREVYLIFKECINNLVRHSACTKADLEFRLVGHRLVLKIKDNGNGFDSAGFEREGKGAGRGGHGLPSMRRRAHALGGTLEIESDHGLGTTVILAVPTNSRQKRWWRRQLPKQVVGSRTRKR